MDVFNSRISLEEASAIVQAALLRELLKGQSAAIFHHLGLMRARLAGLRAAFPVSSLHTLAIKANPVVGILREVVQAGAGLEAASLEEVHLAHFAGCSSERTVFDSPAKTRDEIHEAVRRGVQLNVDNFDELQRVAAVWNSCESKSLVGLRVNPMVGGGTIAHTSVADVKSKFGVPLDSGRQQIIAAFARHEWLRGLHVHVGSQGCSLELLAEAARKVAALRQQIFEQTGRRISQVDIGGGLSTVYRTGETAPSPVEYRALVEERAPQLFAADLRLVTEFGRAIHANCGFAISRVEYVKPLQRLAVIHLGADFLLRPVYRPADWQHEFFLLDHDGRPKTGTMAPAMIAGPLCFAGDIVGRDVPLPPVEIGDFVVIRDCGAYTLSMWSRHCSRGIPAVIGFDPEQSNPFRMLRRAETSEDIVRFWS